MWAKIKAANEQRAKCVADMQAIVVKATDENRDLTAEEQTGLDALKTKAEELRKNIDRLNEVYGIDQAVRQQSQGGPRPGAEAIAGSNEEREIDGFPVKDLRRYSILRAINCLANHRPVDGVEGEVSKELSKRQKKDPAGFFMPTEFPVGDQLQERTGVLNTTTGTGAIATILDVSNFIDVLRNRLIIQRAGARFLTGLVGNLAIPRQSAAASYYWVADSSAPTASNQTIDQVSFSPNTVGAYTDLSRKFLLQSSVSAEAFVRDDLAKILAIAVDDGAINGTGNSNQPTGILQNTTISAAATAIGTNGGVPTWAEVVAMETAVAAANADMGALNYVTNAKVRGLLKGTLRSSTANSKFIWDDDQTVNAYPGLVSNIIPSNLTKASGSALSAMIFGNWNDLIVGMWGVLDILVDPYTNSNTGSVRVRALQDVDIQVRHTASFNIMVDIQA